MQLLDELAVLPCRYSSSWGCSWPAVEDLAQATASEVTAPDYKPIAEEIEGLLRDPLAESAFVRGLALDGEPARALTGKSIEGSSGEVVRAA